MKDLRVGKLVEVRDNKLVVTTPGFINNYEVYQTVDTFTGIKKLNIGFKLTNEIVSKLLGKNIVLWIINDIVVKIGDADTGTTLNDLEVYP